jgi:hypothetical protein
MGGREMEKLRGTCQHPPTGLSSVPSTDVYQIPCESGSSGHSLELEKWGGQEQKRQQARATFWRLLPGIQPYEPGNLGPRG